MRRNGSRERLFFLLLLASALLVLSGLMLRHESAALSTRTFRDGFTVAEGVVRRTETTATADATDSNAAADDSEEPETDVRTTTIKTEDGDEITIKRAATSKGNKITTISRDDKGKLTIEDTTEEEARRTETQGEEQVNALEDIPTGSPSAIHQDTNTTIRRSEQEEEEGDAVVVSGKKVTVVQVNRSLTKVSLVDQEEEVEEATR